jgi:hypothetical protein
MILTRIFRDSDSESLMAKHVIRILEFSMHKYIFLVLSRLMQIIEEMGDAQKTLDHLLQSEPLVLDRLSVCMCVCIYMYVYTYIYIYIYIYKNI